MAILLMLSILCDIICMSTWVTCIRADSDNTHIPSAEEVHLTTSKTEPHISTLRTDLSPPNDRSPGGIMSDTFCDLDENPEVTQFASDTGDVEELNYDPNLADSGRRQPMGPPCPEFTDRETAYIQQQTPDASKPGTDIVYEMLTEIDEHEKELQMEKEEEEENKAREDYARQQETEALMMERRAKQQPKVYDYNDVTAPRDTQYTPEPPTAAKSSSCNLL